MSERYGGRYKAASTSRSSTISATADPDLQFDFAAGKTYVVRFGLMYRAGSASDFRFGFSSGGGSLTRAAGLAHFESPMPSNTALWSYADDEAGMYSASSIASGVTRVIAGSGNSSTYTSYRSHATGMLVFTAASAGTLSVIWAQGSASASEPAVLLSGSYLFFEEIDSSAYPWAIKTADESKSANGGAAPWDNDGELYVPLEANTRYYLELMLMCYVPSTYASRLYVRYSFDGTLDEFVDARCAAPVTYLSSWTNNSASSQLLTVPSQIDTAYYVFNSHGDNSALRGGIWRRSFIKTGSSGGTLRVQWKMATNGAREKTGTLYAGSLLMASQLNACTFQIA